MRGFRMIALSGCEFPDCPLAQMVVSLSECCVGGKFVWHPGLMIAGDRDGPMDWIEVFFETAQQRLTTPFLCVACRSFAHGGAITHQPNTPTVADRGLAYLDSG